MSDPTDSSSDQPKSATETLAALVAKRKAALEQGAKNGPRGGARQSERVAAARSASKSKPAMKK